MSLYGYIAPVAERIAGFSASDLTWVLVIVGLGRVIGNALGSRTADANLRLSHILWPAALIVSLIVVGLVAPFKWPFLAAAFAFGVASFANVPPMQMRVMKYGKAAPELAATANISAFNIANAVGGLIGGAVVDSSFGANAIPFAAAVVPLVALLFILSQEHRSGVGPALSPCMAGNLLRVAGYLDTVMTWCLSLVSVPGVFIPPD
jgi:MFS transporter, DHA1 family, inner membrane transport protein